MHGTKRAPAVTGHLDGKMRAQIGSRLRRDYDAVLSEPLPDRLNALLDRLDEAPAREEMRDDTRWRTHVGS